MFRADAGPWARALRVDPWVSRPAPTRHTRVWWLTPPCPAHQTGTRLRCPCPYPPPPAVHVPSAQDRAGGRGPRRGQWWPWAVARLQAGKAPRLQHSRRPHFLPGAATGPGHTHAGLVGKQSLPLQIPAQVPQAAGASAPKASPQPRELRVIAPWHRMDRDTDQRAERGPGPAGLQAASTQATVTQKNPTACRSERHTAWCPMPRDGGPGPLATSAGATRPALVPRLPGPPVFRALEKTHWQGGHSRAPEWSLIQGYSQEAAPSRGQWPRVTRLSQLSPQSPGLRALITLSIISVQVSQGPPAHPPRHFLEKALETSDTSQAPSCGTASELQAIYPTTQGAAHSQASSCFRAGKTCPGAHPRLSSDLSQEQPPVAKCPS